MARELELIRTASSVGEINLHLQLTPAYRRPIFANEQTRDLVKIYFLEEAKKLGVIISAMDFGPDHAHLFITNWKHCSLEKLVNGLKGFTSFMMRKFHWDLFRSLLWGKKFWSAGYFYRTVGVVTKDAVKYYVEHSQKKHWQAVDYQYYQDKQQKLLAEFN
ncbi:IS200/IS605 family transposase [Candidatus Woesearchaeota archaeon]|nr:IS200/IS605 family transposase [Candidatus Woesearchaeota archaeon]